MPLDLAQSQLLALSRVSLAALRASLLRDAGPAAAAYLQEAGYAGGATMAAAFRDWLAARGVGAPETLELQEFEQQLSAFLHDAGWGTLRIGSLHDAVATLDSDDWGEADPAAQLDFPGCSLTTGLFADLFGRVAQYPLAVLEVECRSAGADRCRFLVGNAEVMEYVYDEMARGVGYEEAVANIR